MPYTTLTLGLTLTIPTNGTRNWGTTMKNTTWTKISQHRHTGSGDGQQIPTAGIADYAVTTIKLARNIGQTQQSALAPAGTTQTIDFNNGTIVPLSLASASGDVTLTLSNPSTGSTYILLITQGATPRGITWPAAVKWANGEPIQLSQVVSRIDKVTMYWNGTNYFADWDQAYA